MHIENVITIEAYSQFDLDQKIMSLIAQGYELSGSLVVSYSQVGDSRMFYQRMVKLKPEVLQE